MKKLVFLFISILFALYACKKEDNSGSMASFESMSIFSSKIGYKWIYKNDSNEKRIREIIRNQVIEGTYCFVLKETPDSSSSPDSIMFYYYWKDDGLYLKAQSIPKRFYNVIDSVPDLTHTDTLYVFKIPNKILHYPQKINDSWLTDQIFIFSGGNYIVRPFSRKYSAKEKIVSKAGSFDCFLVSRDNNNFVEYYSSQGLIKIVSKMTNGNDTIVSNLILEEIKRK